MAEKSNNPPMALADECPQWPDKDFIVRGAFQEGLGQWVEHRECTKPECKTVYRRLASMPRG